LIYFVSLDYSIFTLYIKISMEPHPVPQNVTTFQFKLVGDMTLKQFIYLASGVGTAYLIFLVVVPHYPIFGWPLVLVFVLLGVAFAFLPFKGRPLDTWVKSFFKAIYSPTKRVWIKNGKIYRDDPLFKSRLLIFYQGLKQAAAEEQPAAPPAIDVTSLTHLTPPPPQPPSADLPTGEELKKTVELAKEAQALKLKIVQSEKALAEIKSASAKPSSVPVDYTHQANKIISDLQNLITQASDIRSKLDIITHAETGKVISEGPNLPRIVKVAPVPKPKQQLALTTFPNVINGVTSDRLGNYLDGVVAVIYDKEGLPVRALKTNKLGQFSGATPLPNGVYRLELEKDHFKFDVLQIELTGQILPPLIITAKEVAVS